MVRFRSPAPHSGGVPKWPKGADCKSVASCFSGSNPLSSTILPNEKYEQMLLTKPYDCCTIKRQLYTDREEYPSGQRGQTVNLLQVASVVRIHSPPPQKTQLFQLLSFFMKKN